MKSWIHAVLLAVAAFFVTTSVRAFTPPKPQGYVTDTARILSSAERARVDARLRGIRERTGNHVLVFVMGGSLGNESIEDVAYDTFQAWKIGEAGLDNGVLLVIVPADRRLRLEVGKGLEAELTDLEAAEILRDHVKPHLASMQWERAILAGADAIAARLESRAVMRPSPANDAARYDALRWVWKSLGVGALFAFAWWLLLAFARWIARSSRRSGGSGSSDLFLHSSFDFSGGSSSFDSGGSGDSGGYDGGGGSSGGGGASDSW